MTEEIKKEAEVQETTETEIVDEVAENSESTKEATAQDEVQTEAVAEDVSIEPEIKNLGIIESNLKTDLPDIRSGDTVKVYQILKEKNNKERTQIFEGQVLAVKHGKGITGTITVRKVVGGVGVEKIFPVHTPAVSKIEVVKRTKTRRSKLYYLREAKGRKARLKAVEFKGKEEVTEE